MCFKPKKVAQMTKKILLSCAGGFSTSLLVNRMKEAAEAEGKDYKIKAVNTIIGKVFDKNLVDTISEINGSQEIRIFDFSLLTYVINKYEIQNNFE